ncbi:DUF1996 domain-containing protein [Streptosporangium sp. NBC_01756]|uniref:DUF1996 domain-containing protein n=1 Tax=Streptosporangium sp. NBC_01756 TaxID=2975950 RepID=UPI002DD8DFC3|nr:DUF1996 domain-containing protein [Streptosporangium sp. NBC_01756]WSC90765.1 DUF1996 domain-containing protein [Streptosporangium sp. NBC_01756]
MTLLSTSLPAVTGQASAAEIPLSQGRSVSASSTENAAAPASAAVDGNGGTRWASAFSDPQWLQVDLGATATINKVVLNWENAYATAFTIQTSADGGSWTTVHTTTAGTGGNQTLNVSGSGRYVRMHATKRATQWGVSLWEFQVYGTGGSTQPPPGGGGPIVRVAEFLAECPYTHRLPDDPIVFPGLPGGSHMHSFFGNTSTNAHSTITSLLNADSSCNPRIDLSSYWVPTLYADNVPVEPTGTTFYYLGEGVRDDVIARTQPLPLGLRIVAGNAKATQPDDSTISRWSCLHAGQVGASKDFVNCPAGTMLESYLDFPHCWNGRDLDSADHKSHMAYPVAGDCPASHPVVVPKLRQVLRYPVNGDPARFRLASGPGYTMHGDFFNAWPEAEMEQRVRDCIRPIIKCGADGRP